MRAYKFRSSTNIEFALDILLNRRLYCSDWRELNDPMEGMYVYSARQGQESHAASLVKGIGSEKSRYKICSLASDFQSHLMWAHYASGFSGVAIEVDLPDDDPNICEVRYRGVFDFIDMAQIDDERQAARRILQSKYDAWSYEREIRILHSRPFYDLLAKPVRLIAGPRMNSALFDTLQLVCERELIDFCKIGVGDEGLDADYVEPLSERRRKSPV